MAIREFTSTEGKTWEVLPEGTYDLLIRDKEDRVSSNGNPQLRLTLVVQGGDYAGRTVSDFITFTPKTGWKQEQLCRAAIPGEYEKIETGQIDAKGRPLYSFRFDDDALIDAIVTAKVTIEEDNKGTDQNRINYVAKPALAAPAVPQEAAPVAAPAVSEAAQAPAPAQAAAPAAPAPAPAGRRRRGLQA